MSAVYGPDAFDALIWAAVRRITSRVPQGLTARHEDVLHALALDDRRELVARDLGMSIGTLKSHIGELCDRLGADDARHLGAIVRAEARHGIERLAPNLLSGGLGRQLSLDC
jgi:DNA-binding NarL/FixJ family response regulator